MKNKFGIFSSLLFLLIVINTTFFICTTTYAKDKHYDIWMWTLDENVFTPPHKALFYISVERSDKQPLGAGKGIMIYMGRYFEMDEYNFNKLGKAKAWIKENYYTTLQEWLDNASEKRFHKMGIWKLAPIKTVIYRR